MYRKEKQIYSSSCSVVGQPQLAKVVIPLAGQRTIRDPPQSTKHLMLEQWPLITSLRSVMACGPCRPLDTTRGRGHGGDVSVHERIAEREIASRHN